MEREGHVKKYKTVAKYREKKPYGKPHFVKQDKINKNSQNRKWRKNHMAPQVT